MENKRYFKVLEKANIDPESSHKVGGIYEMSFWDGGYWLLEGIPFEIVGFPYAEYELEEVFDYGE